MAFTVFLAGDVMIGRGIDQVLPYPVDPEIDEPCMKSATGYVELAEQASGPIPRPVPFEYVWGDALEALRREAPQASVVNLETALTRGGVPWPRKEVRYRAAPEHAGFLSAAGIGCCSLANNHALDWSEPGLLDTLDALDALGIRRVGAGRNLAEAEAPAVLSAGTRRVWVAGFGSLTSGIPSAWAAEDSSPGLNLLETRWDAVDSAIDTLARGRRPGDVAIASVHWAGNWGYGIPEAQTDLAHRLVEGGFDIVHGHSSHHVKAIEVYRGRPILYGCGDLVNDYEGIRDGEHADIGRLGLMYFADLDPSGAVAALRMVPTTMRRFQVRRASEEESRRLEALLARECDRFGGGVGRRADGGLELKSRS